jgi:hypothetical protein
VEGRFLVCTTYATRILHPLESEENLHCSTSKKTSFGKKHYISEGDGITYHDQFTPGFNDDEFKMMIGFSAITESKIQEEFQNRHLQVIPKCAVGILVQDHNRRIFENNITCEMLGLTQDNH